MAEKYTIKKTIFYSAVCVLLIVLVYTARYWFYGATVHELLAENKHLKQAITNLTLEEQIGYAKLISQEHREGKLFTTIKFVSY